MTATELAYYLLNKDKSGNLADLTLVQYNGTTSYGGNIRLNKYLYFLQSLALAKNGKPLIDTDFVALPNGPAEQTVMNNYSEILSSFQADHPIVKTDSETEDFINRFLYCFKNATLDDLIEMSHEDEQWVKTANGRPMRCAEFPEYYKDTCKEMLITMYRIDNYDKNWASSLVDVPV